MIAKFGLSARGQRNCPGLERRPRSTGTNCCRSGPWLTEVRVNWVNCLHTIDSTMNDIIPHFFLSYSRGSRRKKEDPYLKRFVKDLRDQVSELVNGDVNEVGFRDVDNLKEGDDWKAGISLNARRSHALVCLYSTRFFDQNRDHEYCGKEFAVFLRR